MGRKVIKNKCTHTHAKNVAETQRVDCSQSLLTPSSLLARDEGPGCLYWNHLPPSVFLSPNPHLERCPCWSLLESTMCVTDVEECTGENHIWGLTSHEPALYSNYCVCGSDMCIWTCLPLTVLTCEGTLAGLWPLHVDADLGIFSTGPFRRPLMEGSRSSCGHLEH